MSERLLFGKAGMVGLGMVAVFVVCLIIPRPAMAGPQRLSLSQAIELALEHNPEVQESFEQVGAAEARVTQAHGAYDLNLFSTAKYGQFNSLGVEDYPYQVNAARSSATGEAGFRQRIPTGAMLSTYYTNIQTNKLGAVGGASYQQYEYLTMELTQSLLKGFGDKEQQGAIQKALLSVDDSKEAQRLAITSVVSRLLREYWVLKLARYNVNVARNTLEMAEELLRRENVRFAQGISQGVDVDRASSAREGRLATFQEYERDVRVMEERVLQLLNTWQDTRQSGIEPATEPKKQVDGLPNVEDALVQAEATREELKQLALLLRQLGIEYDINTNKLLPSVDVSLQYRTSNGVDHLRGAEDFKDTDEQGSWFTGLSVSYPLQNREARGERDLTKKLMRVAEERVRKTKTAIATEVRESMANLQLAEKNIPVTFQAYEASLRTMKGEMERFEMSQSNNRDLLAAQDLLGRDDMLHYKSIIDYNLSLISFQAACGTLLENYHVEIDDNHAFLLQ